MFSVAIIRHYFGIHRLP